MEKVNIQVLIELALKEGATLDELDMRLAIRAGAVQGDLRRWRAGRAQVPKDKLEDVLAAIDDCIRHAKERRLRRKEYQ